MTAATTVEHLKRLEQHIYTQQNLKRGGLCTRVYVHTEIRERFRPLGGAETILVTWRGTDSDTREPRAIERAEDFHDRDPVHAPTKANPTREICNHCKGVIARGY